MSFLKSVFELVWMTMVSYLIDMIMRLKVIRYPTSNRKLNKLIRIAILFIILSVKGAVGEDDVYVAVGGKEEISLTPLAVCGDKKIQMSEASQKCISDCPMPESDYVIKNYGIYDPVQEAHKSDIFYCSSFEETWIFTETWTLSRERRLDSIRKIHVNETQCEKLYEEHCNGRPCQISGDNRVQEEYAYASEIRKTIIYSSGGVMTLTHVDVGNPNDVKVQLPRVKGEVSYKSEKAISKDGLIEYRWNAKEFGTTCPYKDHTVVQCLKNEKRIICPNLGLTCLNSEKLRALSCSAKNLLKCDNNIILEELPDNSRLSRRNYLFGFEKPLSETEKEINSYVNDALRVRDEKNCLTSCLSLSRDGYKNNSLILAGYSFMMYKQGNFVRCRPLQGCEIDLQEPICESPPMMTISCKSEKMWWHMESNFAEKYMVCKRGKQRDTTMTMLSSIGMIKMNKSGAFLLVDHKIKHDIVHPVPHTNRMQVMVVEGILKHVNQDHSVRKNDQYVKSISISHSPFIMSDSWKSIKDYISDLGSEFKLIIFSVMLGMVMILILMIKSYISNLFRTSREVMRSYSPVTMI